ncbi:hypothetical protein RRF57_001047 [Xylaria bambusicola]|uniref:Uncharacterized protein n=1 Tax=Xylaria bambusicola TaxID=326684 RepID=A0AAN7UGJ8_9PEZI
MATPSLHSLFARLSLTPSTSAIPRSTISTILPATSSLTAIPAPSASSHPTPCRQIRSFHMSPAHEAKAAAFAKGAKKKRKGKNTDGPDPRILNLKVSMPRTVPAPLRFARNRALRHWTIHRAWLLYQRKERERQEHELQR